MAKKARIGNPNGRSINADEVSEKASFFCDTDDCDAPMMIVSMGGSTAHFRSKSKQDHKFAICIRNDINFNTDRYDKNLFVLEGFKTRILGNIKEVNIHKGSGGGGTVGTGSRIAPDTLKTIYAAYIESLSSGDDTIGDCHFSDFMRCKENYTKFISNPCGFYIVETSYYHKVKGEFAFILNVPVFSPNSPNYHVKVNFTNSADFWRVYNHHKRLNKSYLSIMLIAAEWKAVIDNSDYIAECTVIKSSQHAYIALD